MPVPRIKYRGQEISMNRNSTRVGAHCVAALALVVTAGWAHAQPKYEVLLSNVKVEAFGQTAGSAKDQAIDVPVFLCRTPSRDDQSSPLLGGETLTGARGFEVCTAGRTMATQGDLVRVHQVYIDANAKGSQCNAVPPHQVLFKENKRQTVFGDGASKVLDLVMSKLLPGLTTAGAKETKSEVGPRWCVASREERLMHTRALLDFEVRKDSKAEGDILASTEVVSGPAEHVFLSGDALPGGAKELRWDQAKKRLAAQSDPQQIYLGVNYMLGDLWGRYDAADTKRITLKLMLSPTRRPFDSAGIGIGYRFADGVFTKGDSKAGDGGFMLFVGHFWTKSDSVDAAGAPVTNGGREKSWRIGVSYSLDTLLGWVNK
jgi:hypothetical protein